MDRLESELICTSRLGSQCCVDEERFYAVFHEADAIGPGQRVTTNLGQEAMMYG